MGGVRIENLQKRHEAENLVAFIGRLSESQSKSLSESESISESQSASEPFTLFVRLK